MNAFGRGFEHDHREADGGPQSITSLTEKNLPAEKTLEKKALQSMPANRESKGRENVR